MNAYHTLIEYFDKRQLKYVPYDADHVVVVPIALENGSAEFCIRTDDDDLITVYARLPIRAPHTCRATIAEAIARVNFGLRVGKFELNFDDGVMLFHASSILPGGVLDEMTIARLIANSLTHAMRRG